MNNYLLSIDLNTTRLNNQNYSHLINSLPKNNLTIHIYNYIEQKHNKIAFNHNETLHQYLGSRKKIALDIPQALDIVELCSNNNYDKVFILCGEYESEYLYSKLNHMNINFCKILPSTLRQPEENNIVKVEINKNDFSSSMQAKINDKPLKIEKDCNNTILHNVENINSEIATSAIENIQESAHINKITSTKVANNSLQNAKNKEAIDLNVLKENFEQILNNKAKNEHSSNQNSATTKLTPEQIKKIYTYIKYRKLIRQI